MGGITAVMGAAEPSESKMPAAARRSSWLDWLTAFQQSAPLAYITILLLQLHRIWYVWVYRDLTNGDTASYFRDAWKWYLTHKVDIAWSPLYTVFYGSMLEITHDVYAATILHRVLIVLASAMLVLAIMRRLLPPSLAWLVAAWWTILPINFNTLYEVHLFALLPIAIAWLIALRPMRGEFAVWNRAIVLAMLVLTTFLVRNEYIVASGVFGAICLIIEYRYRRRLEPAQRGPWMMRTVIVYSLLLASAGGIIYGFYRDSSVRFHTKPSLHEVLEVKHTLNMAQVYAFGYQQRHPEWTMSPWTDCTELCKTVFKVPLPTLWQMLRNNPRALWQHIVWNVSLVPSGWQILLMNTASGGINPDYAPQALGIVWPRYVSLAIIAVVLLGAIVWWFERRKWREWFSERGLGWLAMLAVISVSPAVVITQRPRPSYFFTLGVFSMAVVGTAVWILIRRLRTRRFEWILMLPIMLLGWVYVPAYYLPAPRPLHDDYERLAPYGKLIAQKNVRILAGDSPYEIGSYVCHAKGTQYAYSIMFPEWKGQSSREEFFAQKQLNFVYLNDWAIRMIHIFSPDGLERFMANGGKNGWVLLASGREPGTSIQGQERWLLFERTVQPTPGATWNPDNPDTPAPPIVVTPEPPNWKTAGHDRQ
jgi:hypothetical protein